MAENLDILVSVEGQNQASQSLDTLESKLKSIGDTAQKVGIAFGAIGGVITAGAVTSITAFQEQESAEARLSQIATQVTGSTKEEIQGFKDLAASLQEVGVVGDEVLIAGQSQLASFAKQSETVTMLSDDLADLIVATKGIDASQESAIETANQIGKALQGTMFNAQTGIAVTDELREAFDSASTEMERATVIQQILQDNYGGLNETMRDTSEGGLQALKNSFGDFQEKIGEVLDTAISPFMDKIADLLTTVDQWMTANPELTKTIVLIAGAVGALMLALSPILIMLPGIIAAFGVLSSVIAFVASPVGIIVLAIGALIAAIVFLVWNWDSVWERIKSITENVTQYISDTISAVIDQWILFFETGWEWIKTTFNIGLEAIMFVLTFYFEFYKTLFTTLWNAIKTIATTAFNALKSIYDTHLAGLGDAWNNFWSGAGAMVSGVWETIKSTVKSGINWIIDKINSFIRAANAIAAKGNIIPGVSIPTIPEIPMLAQGGIVTKPTLAMVGEGGESEAIVPLSKAQQMGFGGGGIVVNINNPTVLSDDDIVEKIGDPIMRELKKHVAVV